MPLLEQQVPAAGSSSERWPRSTPAVHHWGIRGTSCAAQRWQLILKLKWCWSCPMQPHGRPLLQRVGLQGPGGPLGDPAQVAGPSAGLLQPAHAAAPQRAGEVSGVSRVNAL